MVEACEHACGLTGAIAVLKADAAKQLAATRDAEFRIDVKLNGVHAAIADIIRSQNEICQEIALIRKMVTGLCNE